MEPKRSSSFTAANTFPLKLLNIKCVGKERKIKPIHVQLNPTNRCNLNCDYCSCSERDKQLGLSLDSCAELMSSFRALGCKSVTVTGGGEPTCHKQISKLLRGIEWLHIKIGLVTNGTLLHKTESLDTATWIRISASDQLETQLERIGSSLDLWLKNISVAVHNFPMVDWAFSYVIGKNPSMDNIVKIVDFAYLHSFTHVRIVNDIFIADQLKTQMNDVKHYVRLGVEGEDDSKVIYQDRSSWTRGSELCYISLLKPVIGADGYIYPCCGTQYALADPSRDYEKLMRMGFWKNIPEIWREQKAFDGSVCKKCYYSSYNVALDAMVNGLKHKEFV